MKDELYIVLWASVVSETGYQEVSVGGRDGLEWRAGAWQFELVSDDSDIAKASVELEDAMAEAMEVLLR